MPPGDRGSSAHTRVTLLLLATARRTAARAAHRRSHHVDLRRPADRPAAARCGSRSICCASRSATTARIKGWGTPITHRDLGVRCRCTVMGWGQDVISTCSTASASTPARRASPSGRSPKLIVTIGVFVRRRDAGYRAGSSDASRASRHSRPNMRIGIAKFAQAFLVGLSVLIGPERRRAST